jgi:2-polyprenyl-6-hydroxyphenyl methylase/3-demethylubiquinone-9 3-methyltransferase
MPALKWLSPEALCFFSTINRNPKAFLLAIVGAEYVLRMLPRGTHEYAKFIRPSELANWAREADLQVNQMTGLLYNPLTKSYKLSASDVDVNYMISTQKC